MGKQKPRLSNGRTAKERYFTVDYPMAHTHAWRSLSGAAVKVWVELRTRYDGHNNGHLRLSLEDGAKKLGLGKSTVRRALKELEAKGFIRKTRQGQFYGRLASEYEMTSLPLDGVLATRNYINWRNPKQPRWPNQKQKLGSEVNRSREVSGSFGNRKNSFGSTSKPVNGNFGASIGSETAH